MKAGYSLFAKPWVQAPSSTRVRDGLGPYFNATSCMSCHPALGRGAPPGVFHQNDPALLFKVEPHTGSSINPDFGEQISPYGVQGLDGEASVVTNFNHSRKPIYSIKDKNLSKEFYLSPRIAPHVAGLGFIELISDEEIIKNTSNGGTPSILKDGSIGRFGWKASTSKVRSQIAAALRNDMGITNSLNPTQPCTSVQFECLSYPDGTDIEGVEISDKLLGYMVEMLRNTLPPKRKKMNISSLKGEKIFASIGCNNCHRADYQLANGQKISPYSDFLLHDMGEELSDPSPSRKAKQWKTPPLWGLGSQKETVAHMRLLHDGRAKGINDAINWHGGEAKNSKNKWLMLSDEEKNQLKDFLLTL
jgi:CxxC motif-containing protein (DUF1111 family)